MRLLVESDSRDLTLISVPLLLLTIAFEYRFIAIAIAGSPSTTKVFAHEDDFRGR